jgi:hypothetical protein
MYKKSTLPKVSFFSSYIQIKTNMETQLFKQISNTKYFVDINGVVYSSAQKKIKVLKPNLHPEGYLQVILMIDKQRKAFLIHRLVALAFLDTQEGKPFINHKDCNKMNNHIDNLEWCNGKENALHASRMGRLCPSYGEKNGRAKLKVYQVEEIRKTKKTYEQLALEYGVSKNTIYKIKKNMLWKKNNIQK